MFRPDLLGRRPMNNADRAKICDEPLRPSTRFRATSRKVAESDH
jgi:hypothetical protein